MSRPDAKIELLDKSGSIIKTIAEPATLRIPDDWTT